MKRRNWYFMGPVLSPDITTGVLQLSDQQTRFLLQQKHGIPITYNHENEYNTFVHLESQKKGDSPAKYRKLLPPIPTSNNKRSVKMGRVVDLFLDATEQWVYAIFSIDSTFNKEIEDISKGYMHGLSLTYVPTPLGSFVVYALSLVRVPHHPRCFITHMCPRLDQLLPYKSGVQKGGMDTARPTIMADAPTKIPAEPSPMEEDETQPDTSTWQDQVNATLSPKAQQQLQASLKAYVEKKIKKEKEDAAKKAKEELEKQYTDAAELNRWRKQQQDVNAKNAELLRKFYEEQAGKERVEEYMSDADMDAYRSGDMTKEILASRRLIQCAADLARADPSRRTTKRKQPSDFTDGRDDPAQTAPVASAPDSTEPVDSMEEFFKKEFL